MVDEDVKKNLKEALNAANKELAPFDKENIDLTDVVKYFKWRTEKNPAVSSAFGTGIANRSCVGVNEALKLFRIKYPDVDEAFYEADIKPDIIECIKKRNEFYQKCYEYFKDFSKDRISIQGLTFIECSGMYPSGGSSYTRKSIYAYFKVPKYCDIPITISVSVDEKGISCWLEIIVNKCENNYEEICKIFNKHTRKPLPKDGSISYKYDEINGRKKIICHIECNTEDEYKEKIIVAMETLKEYYYSTGIMEMKIKEKFKLPDNIDDLEKNIILYGPPGTGKTYNTSYLARWICNNGEVNEADKEEYEKFVGEGRIRFVTFHQSYGYEEFIQGIKPVSASGNLSYEVRSGVFKEFCDTAKKDKEKKYVFIIDEINRGNISKIFGELITLIETSKRGKVSAVLPYSGKQFSVPENVYIIGTMNTADRSIAMLDTALRRRFSFIEMLPDTDVLNGIEVSGINISALLSTINDRIELIYDREHTIGHAFFTDLLEEDKRKIETLASIFENKIIPLLQEYFYDDYEKIDWVLGGKGIFVDKKDVSGMLKKIPESIVPANDGKIYRIKTNRSVYLNPNSYETVICGIKRKESTSPDDPEKVHHD